MDHLSRLTRQVHWHVYFLIFSSNLLLVAAWIVCTQVFSLQTVPLLIILAALSIIIPVILSLIYTKYLMQPVRVLWQAILHVSPNQSNTPAPNLDAVKLGRELVTALSLQVYEIASTANRVVANIPVDTTDTRAKLVMNSLPQPLLVMDRDQTIVFINIAARQYLGKTDADVVGKNMYDVLDLSFPSEDTYDHWLTKSRSTAATANASWEHVRLQLPDPQGLKQFDLAANYSKDNPTGVETIVTLYDHTTLYNESDQSIGFIALAVHELRNPLTLLRGYIDVFKEELEGKLDPELAGFMSKMQVAAQQLSTFVNNILNVARVENNQLVLELSEQKWTDVIQSVIDGMSLKAQIHGKKIEFTPPAELPTVGADRVSIYEVLSNIIDNAIKYSGDGQTRIVIATSLTKEGLVQTTVQDFGAGIPSNLIPNLFQKFYRNHRTQTQVGGTGLGLYLSKAIIDAHGGQIWVISKVGEGTTIGFTLMPYVMVTNKLKNPNNEGITRGAHGWIKNHSLYRR
jgi:signal transduction histidine kinase